MEEVVNKVDEKLVRPRFCYDQGCNVIYSTWNEDNFAKGFSFFCFGKLKEVHTFREREILHENDLSHCYYTPLKGMIRFFCNTGDLWKEATSKLAVLNRLIDVRCDKCGGKQYKIARHVCFSCEHPKKSEDQ
jgi:ribosomal protein L37E